MWETADPQRKVNFDDEDDLPIEVSRDDVMLSGGLINSQENSPDKTLPYIIHLETPSKSLETQDEVFKIRILNLDRCFQMENDYSNFNSSTSCSAFSSLSFIHRIPEMPTGSLETWFVFACLCLT